MTDRERHILKIVANKTDDSLKTEIQNTAISGPCLMMVTGPTDRKKKLFSKIAIDECIKRKIVKNGAPVELCYSIMDNESAEAFLNRSEVEMIHYPTHCT